MIIAIHKLRHNIPLTAMDFKSLEQILTGELGSLKTTKGVSRYAFWFTGRKIAKLEQAACAAFSEFINDQSLPGPNCFVKKIIDYVVRNGYIENVSDLMKPPFDKPQSFVKLFDGAKQKRLVELVNQVKENALKIVG